MVSEVGKVAGIGVYVYARRLNARLGGFCPTGSGPQLATTLVGVGSSGISLLVLQSGRASRQGYGIKTEISRFCDCGRGTFERMPEEPIQSCEWL